MGVAVAGDERPHSVPPGAHGGNIDINLLVEGTALYLPVQVAGALAYVGDPHFAQGDGEVALTALEASLRATLRFDVMPAGRGARRVRRGRRAARRARPSTSCRPGSTPTSTRRCASACARRSTCSQARWGMDEHLAYAYLSAATDFDISQVVDIVCGVHARIRECRLRRRCRVAEP